jgi:hypothetical protein
MQCARGKGAAVPTPRCVWAAGREQAFLPPLRLSGGEGERSKPLLPPLRLSGGEKRGNSLFERYF